MSPDSRLARWIGSPNYWASRFGFSPLYIVMHGTGGTMPGCLNWLASPQSGASVHYLVDREGGIYQLVSEDCAAWANAPIEPGSRFVGLQSNPNWWTLAIEHERWGNNESPITPHQQEASTRLVADIRSRWGHLPLIGHDVICPVNRPNCPGPGFPWTAIDGVAPARNPAITWVRFDGKAQHLPLVFYADASFNKPLYASAADKTILLHFDGWMRGPSVIDPATGVGDTRWYHRALIGVHEQGWVPSAWIAGNAPHSTA